MQKTKFSRFAGVKFFASPLKLPAGSTFSDFAVSFTLQKIVLVRND